MQETRGFRSVHLKSRHHLLYFTLLLDCISEGNMVLLLDYIYLTAVVTRYFSCDLFRKYALLQMKLPNSICWCEH